MKSINRNNLILGLTIFTLIVNVLVLFNINGLYFRAILGFLFLISVPGLLLMLIFKIREVGFWEYLVYTVGLSIAFIMFGGLAVNWGLPALGITDKPLALIPILVCFDIFLLIMGFFAYKRNSDLDFKIKFPKFSNLDRIFIIIPMWFPVLAILGAFVLNNFGSNILTMVLLGSIAVYVLLLVIFRDKLNENVFPWALWMIGLSLLLASSMRSWFIVGGDANAEYSIFKMTEVNGFWNPNVLKNSYNAMLSITILPSIIHLFTFIHDSIIQKIIITLIFSLLTIIVFLFSKKYVNYLFSFLAGFFFISQPTFTNWLSIPSRQEIAFLFFGLMLLVLFVRQINLTLKKVLFVIFGFSMIVSHYSTAYIALAIFLFTYLATIIYVKWKSIKGSREKLKKINKQEYFITGGLILLLIVSGFLWYSQVTPTADGLIDFAHKSFSNFRDMFNEDLQAEGSSLMDQVKVMKKIDSNKLLINYLNDTITSQGIDSSLITNEVHIKVPQGLPSNESINYVIYFRGAIRVLSQVLLLIGGLLLLRSSSNNKLLFLSSLILFCLLLSLPFFSISYDAVRTYQQFLILFSFLPIFGLITLIKKFNIGAEYILFILLMSYFFLMPLFLFQFFGGPDLSISLNNLGKDYTQYYLMAGEVYSAKWVINKNAPNILLASTSITRFFITDNPLKIQRSVVRSLFPLTKSSYVYVSYSNKIKGIAYQSYNNNPISFNFPAQFLNENKNKIYNNGGSEIFK